MTRRDQKYFSCILPELITYVKDLLCRYDKVVSTCMFYVPNPDIRFKKYISQLISSVVQPQESSICHERFYRVSLVYLENIFSTPVIQLKINEDKTIVILSDSNFHKAYELKGISKFAFRDLRAFNSVCFAFTQQHSYLMYN